MRERSVTYRLKRGLALTTLVGLLLLIITVVYFYWKPITDLPSALAFDRAIREMLEHVALPLIILMGPVLFVGLRVIGSAFAPLEEAAESIEAARGQERGFRIDTSRMPTEALPFTNAVNDLLTRLDDAATRHEAFAADVAHELRTPLAVLLLELDRLDNADALRLKGDVTAMQRLIEQLMLLAQLDASAAAQVALEPVSLKDVATQVVSFMAPEIIAAGRIIALDTSGVDVQDPGSPMQRPIVQGRREALAAALRNLIENAARVTPVDGAIHVRVGPGAVIGVADEGPGLSPEQLTDLARRLRRADHASHNGAGLGLAIVDRIITAHGGKLMTDPDKRELSLHF
ncbi:MAG: HAMP domain-containing histidine kinase [Nevskiaceae bacterium]|jgi:signal transduction histidine kinase|nr:HAMP domain-containing histidine kinase [Nevskiaceae bacterium]